METFAPDLCPASLHGSPLPWIEWTTRFGVARARDHGRPTLAASRYLKCRSRPARGHRIGTATIVARGVVPRRNGNADADEDNRGVDDADDDDSTDTNYYIALACARDVVGARRAARAAAAGPGLWKLCAPSDRGGGGGGRSGGSLIFGTRCVVSSAAAAAAATARGSHCTEAERAASRPTNRECIDSEKYAPAVAANLPRRRRHRRRASVVVI